MTFLRRRNYLPVKGADNKACNSCSVSYLVLGIAAFRNIVFAFGYPALVKNVFLLCYSCIDYANFDRGGKCRLLSTCSHHPIVIRFALGDSAVFIANPAEHFVQAAKLFFFVPFLANLPLNLAALFFALRAFEFPFECMNAQPQPFDLKRNSSFFHHDHPFHIMNEGCLPISGV